MAPVLLNPHRFGTAGGGAGYVAEVLADSPLAYYRLNETSGSTMADSSGNGRDGTYQLPAAMGVAGLLSDGDKAVEFSGGSGGNRCEVLDAAWMDVSSITVKARIRFDSMSSTRMVVDRDYSSGTRHWQFRTNAGKLEFLFWTTTAGPFTAIGTTTLSAATVYELAATYDGSVARVFVNGAQDGTLTQAGSLKTGSDNILIGVHRAGPTSWSTQVDGVIDEVAIYGSALSQSRLAAHVAAA